MKSNVRQNKLSTIRLVFISVAILCSIFEIVTAQSGVKVGPVTDITWSPDGTKIAVAVGPSNCSDSGEHRIEVLDATTGIIQQTLTGHSCPILSIAWNRQGTEIASGSEDSTMRVWDMSTGQTRLVIDRNETSGRFSLTWSPDGTKIANLFSGGEWIEVWDAINGDPISTLTGHSDPINSIEWSPVGDKLVSGASDNTVRIWDATTGQNLQILQGHTHSITSVYWNPDGTKIASGSGDNTVRIWDATTGQNLQILRGHTQPVFAVKWSANSEKIATGSLDSTLRTWDAATMLEMTLYQSDKGPITDVEWSPDGTKIAYVGINTRLYDSEYYDIVYDFKACGT